MVKSSCNGGSDCSESVMATTMGMELDLVSCWRGTTAYQHQFLHKCRLSSILVGNNSWGSRLLSRYV